jgi:hypothetical protein
MKKADTLRALSPLTLIVAAGNVEGGPARQALRQAVSDTETEGVAHA